MLLHSAAIDRLVEAFRCLPGVGKRSAERLALYLLSAPEGDALELGDAVRNAREKIHRCGVCQNLTEAQPCTVCADERRDRSLLCVVETPSAAMAMERGGSYRGQFHVLHGALNPLDGIGPSELGIERLLKRLESGEVKEMVVATNTTAEGEATAMYLSRQVSSLGVKVTRIAHGVPMGGGLEYADEVTLAKALEGRTAL